jgi:pyruvate formate lyase activating enzyme
MKQTCPVCPHACALAPGQTGLCGARANEGGRVFAVNYGRVTALALDPIEKKPLNRFYPGSHILSVGSFGCNLRCPFCQNSDISMRGAADASTQYIGPEALVARAESLRGHNNVGIAYTYNEPLIGYEYVMDCARLAREKGLKNVAVTNGYIRPEPLAALLPYIDAMNIDVKAFTESFYAMAGGSLAPVKEAVRMAAGQCHLEVTTLVIPGKNDTPEEMDALSAWLASIDAEIPLHVSRFFPRYHMTDVPPTPVETIHRLAGVARGRLKHVYTGNC